MASDALNLIQYVAARHALLNMQISLSSGADDGLAWSCSAQWETDGEGSFNGRGVVNAYGSDPVAAVLDCVHLIASKQAGCWPLRSAPALQVAA